MTVRGLPGVGLIVMVCGGAGASPGVVNVTATVNGTPPTGNATAVAVVHVKSDPAGAPGIDTARSSSPAFETVKLRTDVVGWGSVPKATVATEVAMAAIALRAWPVHVKDD